MVNISRLIAGNKRCNLLSNHKKFLKNQAPKFSILIKQMTFFAKITQTESRTAKLA